MRLLVVGGTRFLGRHLVAQALAAGHAVTLLHRGQSGPGLFPDAEHRIADRNGDLAALDDAAIVSELKSRIANFKIPKHVHIADDLPRNTMGKVQKNLLREQHKGLFAA